MAFHGRRLRDHIAEDFKVTVTSQLEHYIKECNDLGEEIKFAHVGLLLIESSVVYRKRVDYLYNLVNRLLEQLIGNKRPTSEESRKKEGMDRTAVHRQRRNVDEKFTSLDDISAWNGIDLVEEGEKDTQFVCTLPLVPLSLIPLSATEKDGIQLIGLDGEIVGNYKEFKMNTSTIHSSCVLLLDKSYAKFVDYPSPQLNSQYCEDTSQKACLTNEPATSDRPALKVDIQDGRVQNKPCSTEFLPLDDIKVQKNINLKNDVTSRSVGTSPHIPVLLLQNSLKEKQTTNLSEIETILGSATMDSSGLLLISYSMVEDCTDDYLLIDAYSLSDDGHDVDDDDDEHDVMADDDDEPDVMADVEDERDVTAEVDDDDDDDDHEHEITADVDDDDEPDVTADADDGPDVTADVDDDDEREVMADVDDDDECDVTESTYLPYKDSGIHMDQDITPSQIEEGDTTGPSYEDILRRHVDQFYAQIQTYAKSSELAQSVAIWERILQAALLEEKKRRPFDVRQYAEELLQMLDTNKRHSDQDEGSPQSFADIMIDKPAFEISRMFSAALQLANDGRIQIRSSSAVNDMTIKLLSRKRHHSD